MRILGIEFGAWSLKAVEMESRFRRLDLLELHEIRLPLEIGDPVSIYKQAVERLLARLPAHPEKTVTSLPPAQTALRFIQLPVKSRKKVEQMFRFELEDNIPFKLDDCVIEHLATRTKEGSVVFVAIAPKSHVQTHLNWLKEVGIDPDWLTFEGMGVVNLYLSTQKTKEDREVPGPCLLMDIGHLKTNVAILGENRLELYRSLAWGGLSITQSIASALNLNLDQAEEKKMKGLNLNADIEKLSEREGILVEAASYSFVPFIADVQHCLVTYRSLYHREAESILITGGTSNLTGLAEFISKSFGIPTDFFRPFTATSFKREIDPAQDLRFGEALGRAMVFARKSALLFNFRKEELSKETSLKEVTTLLRNPSIIALSKYAGVLILILFIHVGISKRLGEKEANAAMSELKRVYQDTFRALPAKLRATPPRDPADLKKLIEQKNKELEQKLKTLARGKTPYLAYIRSISDSFPGNIRVDVNILNLDDRSFTIEGVLYEGELKATTELLRKNPYFNNVTLNQEGQRFTYRGEIRGR